MASFCTRIQFFVTQIFNVSSTSTVRIKSFNTKTTSTPLEVFIPPVLFLRKLFDVHRHIQYKAQKQHRGDKTLSSEQLPEYGNSSVLFECLMVDVVDVQRHIQYKAQKQHRGDKTLS